MTHPIDPLTPEAITARILWEAAKGDDILRFLDVWERMIAGHAKEVEDAYDGGKANSGSYDHGYMDGEEEGYERGMEDGRARTLAELKKEKDGQPPRPSSE